MSWDTDTKGQAITFPLVGWQTAATANTLCVLQIRYAETAEQLTQGEPSRVPLVMSPAQALELAEDLRQMAEHALALTLRQLPN